jgi:benzylsuccinate CoA-transferase BbsF subunit
MQPANYYCDYNAGVLGAFTAIAALRHRARTGEGQHAEAAMLEGELQVVAEALMEYAANGRVQNRSANAHPTMAPHGVYRCAGDRWLAIACEDDVHWQRLCTALGQPEFAADARFADVVSRVRNRAEVDAFITEWTRARDPFDAERTLQDTGVPAGAVRLISELLADEQLHSRQFIEYVEHPDAGATPRMRAAFTLAGADTHAPPPAPLYGQDNDWVLCELLGLADVDVQRLREGRIVADSP